MAIFSAQLAHLARVFRTRYYTVATIHAALGTAAELLGIYILLVAGTELVPRSLRFTRWKRWMRIELAMWLLALTLGIGTYYEWYVVLFR